MEARCKLLRQEGYNSGYCITSSTGSSKKVGLGRCVAFNQLPFTKMLGFKTWAFLFLGSIASQLKKAGAGAKRNNPGQMREIVGQLIHSA